MTTTHIQSTTTPCPGLVRTSPPATGYTEEPTEAGVGAYGRDHTCNFGDATGAAVTAYALAASDGTPEDVELEGIHVWINGTNSGAVMTAAQARALATNLLAAADKLDQINGDSN